MCECTWHRTKPNLGLSFFIPGYSGPLCVLLTTFPPFHLRGCNVKLTKALKFGWLTGLAVAKSWLHCYFILMWVQLSDPALRFTKKGDPDLRFKLGDRLHYCQAVSKFQCKLSLFIVDNTGIPYIGKQCPFSVRLALKFHRWREERKVSNPWPNSPSLKRAGKGAISDHPVSWLE